MSFIFVFSTCNETRELCTAYKIINPAAIAVIKAARPAATYFGISCVLTESIFIGSCLKVTPKYYVLLLTGASGSKGYFSIVNIGT